MKRKPPSAQKPKSIARKAKARPAKEAKAGRSFEDVVGPEVYRTWVTMLQTLVPEGRTQRLGTFLAAMLQFATSRAEEIRDRETDETSLVFSLLEAGEVSDLSEVKELIDDAVAQLIRDAQVKFERRDSHGEEYSIADTAYAEYHSWYEMPWE